jgi:hypothetical protein
MKTNKLTFLSTLLLAASGLLLTNCQKDNEAQQVLVVDRPAISRTINYTVLVVAGETSATGSSASKSATVATGAANATVDVAVNGTVLSKTTDVSGQATFTNLTAGLAAVTVTLAGHTTVNYIVNLYHIDTLHYDNEKQRISSTKVIVFPTSGTGMITVSGVVRYRNDVSVTFNAWSYNNASYSFTSPATNVPSGTVITAEVPKSELAKYVTMLDGGGSLTDVTYEGVSFTATVDATGNYSLSVPSTAMGLAITIRPVSFAGTVTYSVYGYANDGSIPVNANGNYLLTAKTVRFIYSASTSSVSAYTYKNEIVDITYATPVVTDTLYFGF